MAASEETKLPNLSAWLAGKLRVYRVRHDDAVCGAACDKDDWALADEIQRTFQSEYDAARKTEQSQGAPSDEEIESAAEACYDGRYIVGEFMNPEQKHFWKNGARWARGRTQQALRAVTEEALFEASVDHEGTNPGTRSAWCFRKGALWLARQTGAVVKPKAEDA